jgi:beta-glucanase (GH16 family)
MRALFPLVALSCLALAQQRAAPPDLTFSDEFNGTELDPTKWVPHEPTARAQTNAPEAVALSGGQLHIVARASMPGIATTFGTFAQTYGRFEIRCKVPAVRGLHSRFRLLPVPFGPLPEIDVFETDGGAPSRVSFANHWGTEQTERSFGDAFSAPDLSAAFHVIAVEWDRDKISWFIDGKKRFESVDGVPRQPMFLAVELSGGDGSLDIDYIRVYRRLE